MVSLHNPNHNPLLAALTPAESARLSPNLELVSMPLGIAGVWQQANAITYFRRDRRHP